MSHIDRSIFRSGTAQSIIKNRNETRPGFLKLINAMLEEWDGSAITIVVNHSDQNSQTEETSIGQFGVSDLEGSLKMAYQLHEASRELIDRLIENCDSLSIIKALNHMLKEEEEEESESKKPTKAKDTELEGAMAEVLRVIKSHE